MKRISVDIGGTFSDCFFVWDDIYVEAKALTTHHNLALGFNEALDLACSRAGVSRSDALREVDSVRYATTLGTNALIEARAPKSPPWLHTDSKIRSTFPVVAATAKASTASSRAIWRTPNAPILWYRVIWCDRSRNESTPSAKSWSR